MKELVKLNTSESENQLNEISELCEALCSGPPDTYNWYSSGGQPTLCNKVCSGASNNSINDGKDYIIF